MADDAFYSAADRARLYLVAAALQPELEVRVHCDLVPAQGLWRQRGAYAALLATCEDSFQRPLAELVNPLVITDDGVLKPIAYDFHARFDVAAVDGLSAERLRGYKDERLASFRDLIGAALARLEDTGRPRRLVRRLRAAE